MKLHLRAFASSHRQIEVVGASPLAMTDASHGPGKAVQQRLINAAPTSAKVDRHKLSGL